MMMMHVQDKYLETTTVTTYPITETSNLSIVGWKMESRLAELSEFFSN